MHSFKIKPLFGYIFFYDRHYTELPPIQEDSFNPQIYSFYPNPINDDIPGILFISILIGLSISAYLRCFSSINSS